MVALLDNGGTVLNVMATTNGGHYTFTNLLAGTYVVSFSLPAGYVFTSQDAYGNAADLIDSDANAVTGATAPILLTSNTYTTDAGVVFVPTVTPTSTPTPTPTPTPIRHVVYVPNTGREMLTDW